MAFDTLANGLTAADITYRMLLLWKRRVAYYYRSAVGCGAYDSTAAGDAQVDMLVQAVAAATGNTQAADVIAEHHRTNSELTPDCFLANEYSQMNIQPITNGHAEVPRLSRVFETPEENSIN